VAATPGERDRRGGSDSVVRHFDRFVVTLGQLSLSSKEKGPADSRTGEPIGPLCPFVRPATGRGVLFRPGVTGAASIERMFDTSQDQMRASSPERNTERELSPDTLDQCKWLAQVSCVT
jgi:hypothetical protein